MITVLTIIYVLCTILLSLTSVGILSLLVLWVINHHHAPPQPTVQIDQWPGVTVQLPIYNEITVVKRLIDAITNLDYPKESLTIQLLDDSDDDTSSFIASMVCLHKLNGFNIHHIQRKDRIAYKAGALNYGMALTSDDYLVIFDADFIPDRDFLKQTIPHFIENPKLGILQTRWAHLNAEQNILTRCQALSIDRHFVIEQMARNRSGLLMSFNGSAGIWRRACIHEAGGWSGQTITEDLDLSYRAQMRGWQYLYLPQIKVPAEIPPQMIAFKRQQARWAKGTTQNFINMTGNVWHHKDLTVFQKLMSTLHLAQYLPQPIVLLMTLLTPILMVNGILQTIHVAPLGIASIAAPLMYVISQRHLYDNWRQRMIAFPILLILGSGLIFNNTVAIIEAFLKRPSVFKRTPKFSDAPWQNSRYALRPDWTTLIEAILMVYTAIGGIIALNIMPSIAPFLFGQMIGFGVMVGSALRESVMLNYRRQSKKTSESLRSTIQ